MSLPRYLKHAIILFSGFMLLFSMAVIYLSFMPNVSLPENKSYVFIKIPSNSNYEDVVELLEEDSILKNHTTFDLVAQKKNYPSHVYSGNYKIVDKMSNNQLINLLRSGKQSPVDLVFNNIRTKGQLAGVVSRQIEADSANIDSLLRSEEFLSQYGLNIHTALTIFIPNTYEFFWDTDAKRFIQRMVHEHKSFWDGNRSERLKNINLDKAEVYILASIVDEETTKVDEMDRIAGVYMNRLKKGMPLQADPTVKYANSDFTMRRVLKRHLEVRSPYNTYMYKGLPPGPISIPSIASIDAVLNYDKNDYLYFCARDDFSGYHVFAKTLRQHMINARKYQRALSRNRIYE